MGTEYRVYAEARARDRGTGAEKWISLNPVFRAESGEYKSGLIIWFSHSSMCEVYYELERHVVSTGVPEDCSAELATCFGNLDEIISDWGRETTRREAYKHEVFVVGYEQAVKQKVKKDRPFKYMYYVPRESMAAFQCGEIDSIENWLTHQEYVALEEDAQREYVYFEWNNWYDEYQVFCEIARKVDTQIDFFNDVAYQLGFSEISGSDVRLIVRRC